VQMKRGEGIQADRIAVTDDSGADAAEANASAERSRGAEALRMGVGAAADAKQLAVGEGSRIAGKSW
jgi:hypothetical protein